MESRKGDLAVAAEATSSRRGKYHVDRGEAVCSELAGAPQVEERIAIEVGNHKKIDVTAQSFRSLGVKTYP